MSNILNSQQVKLYLRLKQQEYGIDKSLAVFIDNAKSDFDNWKSIKSDIAKFECERQKISDPQREMIINVYQDLKSIKALMTADGIKKLDLESFKKNLQSLWKKIQELKDYCSDINDLVNEQKNLSSEVDDWTRKIRKHEKFSGRDNFYTRIINVKAQLQKEESKKECDYSSVENFFALISASGHSGGWSEQDHLLFVKLRKRHKNPAELVEAFRAKCPDLSEEEVMKHESWYQAYLDLRAKQRAALQEWRKRRAEERKSPGSEPRRQSEINNGTEEQSEIESRRQALEEWKERKRQERIAEEASTQDRLRTANEAAEKRRRARARRIKQIVAERKGGACDPITPGHQTPKKSSGPTFKSSLLLQMYRARDQQFLEKRKKILAKINAPKEQLIQLHRQDTIKSLESTLLKETKAWQERLKIDPKITQTVFYVKDLPRLGKCCASSTDSSLNRQL